MKTQVGVGDVRLSELARRYVNEVLATNRLSYGPYSERFEAEFARLHGCAHALFCNSGTSALQMALAALRERHGWRDGDEVLVPATTFIATSNIVIHNRLRPVFVDVTLADYGMDPEDMARHITPRTRAVIPVHLCGLPCSIGPIMEVAQRHRLQVIEDSCQTMFARYHGITVGAFGAVGCFSTHAAHLVVTGVGGLATTNDGDLALTLKSLCSHGRDGSYLKIDDDQGVSRERLTEIVARRFSFVRLGHSLRGTEMEAALGLAQLEEREPMLKARRANAAALRAGLADLTGCLALPPHPTGREHAYMVFPLRVHGGADERRALVNFLEENGIETRDLFPLLTQPIYRARFGDLTAKYPVASELATSGFYVGCHPGMSQADLDYVTDRLHAFPWPGRRRWNGSAPSPGGGMGPQG